METTVGRRLRPVAPLHEAALTTLVENRRVSTYDDFALNLFETHIRAEQVELTFRHFVLTTMLGGRKVMHLSGTAPFEYLPGESVLLPADRPMHIDFPDAQPGAPTQCLALEISEEKVRSLVSRLNEQAPRTEASDRWQLNQQDCHLANPPALAAGLDRLIAATQEAGPHQGVLADLAVTEIVVRLLQTQVRHVLLAPAGPQGHRLRQVVEYVRANLHRDISADELARLACLSRAQFFRAFRRELGLSPVEFILRERVEQACRLLRSGNRYLADVAYRCGFSSPSYFTRVFKAATGYAPGQWLREGAKNAAA